MQYFYTYRNFFIAAVQWMVNILLFAVLAIVDSNYKFIYIDVGTNGRVNDALVFF